MLPSSMRRQWNKRFVAVLNRPWAGTRRKPGRQTRRLIVEELESRLMLDCDPPGNYNGILTGNREWCDTRAP